MTISVLVVEDEARIAEAHVAFVGRLPGFTVVGVAHRARDAVALARVRPVDLVLLDLGLPDGSGVQVCAALKGLTRSPDVIAITSARDLAVVRSAVASGVLLYLLKPFTFAAFRDKLERYAQYRAALAPDDLAVSQADVDAAMATLRSVSERSTSPKGVTPETLQRVAAVVRGVAPGCSAAEVGAAIGVSRVTAWRYLERLAGDGVLTRHTEHGRTGRPLVRYRRAD